MSVQETKARGTAAGLALSLAGVAALAAGLAILGAARSRMGSFQGWTILIAAAGLTAAIWPFRRPLFRWTTSLPFAGALLIALIVATALGTFIPQGLSSGALEEKYGAGLGGFLASSGLGDIFRTFAFRGLLAVLALSMVLVIVRRRAWRVPEWGPFLAHGGIAVIILGGLAGGLGGARGFIEMHEGETADSMAVRDAAGRPTGERRPLGFGLRLDRFELERYPVEYRLYLYRENEDGFRVQSSTGVEEAREWVRVPGTDQRFRLVEAYPDLEVLTELQEKPEGEGVPALQLRVPGRDGAAESVTLLAGVKDREEIRVDRDTSVRFAWEDEASRWTEPAPEAHLVVFRESGNAPPEETRIRPGERYSVGRGQYEISVLEYFPDFVYDSRRRQGSTRSDRPHNPALRVALRKKDAGPAEERWLFANNPGFGREHGGENQGPDLRYVYVPASDPAGREFVVVGKTREVVEYDRGSPKGRTPLVPGEAFPAAPGIAMERFLPSAEETVRPSTRSREWRRPAAEIEARAGDETHRTILVAGEPVRLGTGGAVLSLEKKSNDIRAFRSRVSVLEGGASVRRETLSVNHPLSHRGFWLYQSDYRPKDPTYSGILVVKDPGLGVVYAGFVMLCAGMILSFYVRPRLRRAARGEAPP